MDVHLQKPNETRRSKTMQILLGFITNLSNLAPGITLGFSAILLPVLTAPGPENISMDQGSWIASTASITMPIGCLISGPILDKFGRKMALYIVNILSLVGWIFIAGASHDVSWMYVMLLIGRAITGVATGMGSIPATVYLSEISTPKLRAMLATWTSVFIAIGVLIIYLLGLFLKESWRVSAQITVAIPTVALIAIYFLMPESPQWLIGRKRIQEAEHSLARIWRVDVTSPYIKDEVEKLIQASTKSESDKSEQKTLITKITRKIKYFLRPGCIKPFVIMVSYFFFQQFSGTFVIVFYAVQIVENTGVQIDPYLSAVIIGISRVVASFMVGPICKRYGRRPPSIISGATMSISMICLAGYLYAVHLGTISPETAKNINWLPVLLIILYFFTSTLGFLTIPFAMIAEMYPAKVRGLAGGMTACLCYVFNFITVKTYPQMVASMHEHGVYGFYGAVSLVGTVFVVLCLPETKGKTLQEIEDYFNKGRGTKMDERTALNNVTRV